MGHKIRAWVHEQRQYIYALMSHRLWRSYPREIQWFLNEAQTRLHTALVADTEQLFENSSLVENKFDGADNAERACPSRTLCPAVLCRFLT